MFISHRYRFIFVRTEKTAGTSLAAGLAAALPTESEWARGDRPAWARYSPIHHGALTRNLPQVFGLHPHATARQIRQVISPAIFDSYFTFAVERNPWDRQVSLYYQRKHKRPDPDLDFDRDMRSIWFRNTEYVRMNNWRIYSDGRWVMVDRVLRYENLQAELDALFAELGVEETIELPRSRAGFRLPDRDYREEYSDWTRDLVARWYRPEIEALGYEF